MPDIFRKAFHLGIVGGSGTGKTEYAKRFFAASRHDRVFIFDHMGEYPSRLGSLAVVATSFDAMVTLAEKYRIVIFDPSEEFGGMFQEVLPIWCDQVFAIAKAVEGANIETLAVIDELQKLVNVHNTPIELKNLLQTGRKFKLDTCFVSQQPNRLPNEVIEQWTELAAFRLKTDASQDALEMLGFSSAEIERFALLPDLHYVWRNLVNGNEVADNLKFSS